MKAPSFRCSEENDGSFILHYYSIRSGLEFIVILKTVLSRLANSQVDCKLIKSKEEDGFDHVQFHIIEKCNKLKIVSIIEFKNSYEHFLS